MNECEVNAHATRPQVNRQNRSTSVVSPKGILKNKMGPQESRSPHLTWDEPNLALNDLNRDSTMKITEPKTPFVRYDPETDQVLDLESIPDFDLGRASSLAPHSSPHEDMVMTEADQLGSQRATLIRRASSTSSRRNSGSTERRQVLVQPPPRPSSAAGDNPLDDEEDDADLDPDTKAKHDAFVRARKGHYGNEAEAMKKARELAEKDEIDSEATVESDLLGESTSNVETGLSVPNGA